MDWLKHHTTELKKEQRNLYKRTKFIQKQMIEMHQREIRKIVRKLTCPKKQ